MEDVDALYEQARLMPVPSIYNMADSCHLAGIMQTVPAVPVKYSFLFLSLSPHFPPSVLVDIVPEEQELPAQEQQE